MTETVLNPLTGEYINYVPGKNNLIIYNLTWKDSGTIFEPYNNIQMKILDTTC
jgi:hypothetical protein